MPSTYAIEDHVYHKLVKYQVQKSANIVLWLIVFASLFQILVLWVLVGGGEAFIGLRFSAEPLPIIEYWSLLLFILIVVEIVTIYFLAWTLIAERSLEFGVNGLIYISSLWGFTKNKTYALMDINEFLINETSHKGNETYSLALIKGSKTLSISPSLSKEDAGDLVDIMREYKGKTV